jgi:hypothetical protein
MERRHQFGQEFNHRGQMRIYLYMDQFLGEAPEPDAAQGAERRSDYEIDRKTFASRIAEDMFPPRWPWLVRGPEMSRIQPVQVLGECDRTGSSGGGHEPEARAGQCRGRAPWILHFVTDR